MVFAITLNAALVYVLLASLEDELLLGLAGRALQSKDDLLGLTNPATYQTSSAFPQSHAILLLKL